MTTKLRLYGLKNCDSCRAARSWAAGQNLAVEFVDLRDTPVDTDTLETWLAELGADALVNRRSTTWRGLGEADRALAASDSGVVRLLSTHPTLIKRPVIEAAGTVSTGFDAAVRARLAGLVG